MRRIVLGVLVVSGLAMILAGFAQASASSPTRLTAAHPGASRQMTLAQAPAALRAAVRRSLAVPMLGGAFQQAKLTANDGAAGDHFGWSVAISGSTAVVGAPDKNSNTGAAYVFVRSGSAWSQQTELTASDASAGDNFGTSVAIDGSTALIGAYGKNTFTGAAYVFVRSGTTWTEQAKLTAPDASTYDVFGNAVALYGSTAVIGANGKTSDTGAAYVFVRSGSAWSQQATLTPSDLAAGDQFGVSTAIYGSTAVIGARNQNSNTGAAYVFIRSGSAWSQQAKLTASDAATNDYFGNSAAIYGSTAVIGAPHKTSNTGAAYVFVRSGSAWSQQAELTASDGATNDYFGYPVSLSGSTVVIGAEGRNSLTGASYVLTRSGSAWSQEAELTASDGASNDYFAAGAAISGSNVVVGAPGKNSYGGAAYVFALPSQQGVTTASDGAASDYFGGSVAISGSTAVVAAYRQNSYTGAAYVFVRSGSVWSQQAKLTSSDGFSGQDFGVSVALSGSTAVIGAYGDKSATGAAYVFTRSGTTWTQQAKLTGADSAPGDFFGKSVAIWGPTLAVGAYGKNLSAGAAYVFTLPSTGVWTQQAKLTASDGAANDRFGGSVAISGSTVIVGAPNQNSTTGAAYVFKRSSTGVWTQQAKLTAPDGAASDYFGISVGVSGSTSIIGAYGKNSNTGAAYVFANPGTGWSQQAELTAADGAVYDHFGWSVSISGTTVLVGSPFTHSYTGAAYVFIGSGSTWSQAAKLTAGDAAANDEFGSSTALSGSSAMIGAYNKNSGAGAAYPFTNV